MASWRGEGEFQALLNADPVVNKHLNPDEIGEMFDLAYHFAKVDEIFSRIFSK